MKRRKVLTSASVLAGAALTGCGGGGEDDALGGDPSSQIGAYTVPATVVPKNAQYHVEVAFAVKHSMLVSIDCGTYRGELAVKGATTNISHKLHFATIRCNGDTVASDFKALRIYTLYSDNGAPRGIFFGGVTTSNYAQYVTYTIGETDVYEWRIREAIGGAVTCIIRFIQLVGDEAITFNAGEYVRLVTNTTTHEHAGTNTIHYPQHHPTVTRLTNYEAGVIHDSTGNRDSIAVPNAVVPDHYELIPSIMAASKAEKPFVRRRMRRHLRRFAGRLQEVAPFQEHESKEFHALGNEMSRVVGGKSLIDYLNTTISNVRTSIQNNVSQAGDALHAFAMNHLPGVMSDDLNQQVRALLSDPDVGKGRGGMSIGSSIQLGCSIEKLWPGIYPSGGGVRLSFGLCRASLMFPRKEGDLISTYRVTRDALDNRGLKLAVVLIIKGFNGSQLFMNGISMDIEISVNMTIRNDGCRVDSIVIDPVLDFDTRTWCGRQLNSLFKYLIGPTYPSVTLPKTIDPPPALLTRGEVLTKYAEALDANSGEVVTQGLKAALDPAAKQVAGGAWAIRTWGVAEDSPLRVILPNSDVNDPNIAFRGGFRFGGMGWQPGQKYIVGMGAEGKYTVGGLVLKGFGRIVVIGDAFCMFGPDRFIRSAGNPWLM